MKHADPMKCECLRWCREWKPGELRGDGQRVLTHHPRCTEAVGYCVHKYRSDEYCPACKMIEAEAERDVLRDSLEKTLASLIVAANSVYRLEQERDDLREQVARLTKQRDVARKERDGMVQRRYRWKEAVEERNAAVKERDELREQVAQLEEERAAWQFEANRLHATLEKYGQHTDQCYWARHCGPGPCTCGLDEALSKASEESRQ